MPMHSASHCNSNALSLEVAQCLCRPGWILDCNIYAVHPCPLHLPPSQDHEATALPSGR